ncbi:hypothetical protein PCANC_05265 [Puccinia coronata f. sp. avenae]|uniref:Uncharacterized protein n=1 Tax=Puccinia coronata f. sp. avenae TaxID=200324 RepID=A0A2N5VYQ7_9BASI|nr:hypothetical protein PCASD_03288 [Puccinia coronata f. sp. avenae]PLW55120.1 hypothetical protein PCANC_05265 [Puccinia coronata f. sp. avenae]
MAEGHHPAISATEPFKPCRIRFRLEYHLYARLYTKGSQREVLAEIVSPDNIPLGEHIEMQLLRFPFKAFQELVFNHLRTIDKRKQLLEQIAWHAEKEGVLHWEYSIREPADGGNPVKGVIYPHSGYFEDFLLRVGHASDRANIEVKIWMTQATAAFFPEELLDMLGSGYRAYIMDPVTKRYLSPTPRGNQRCPDGTIMTPLPQRHYDPWPHPRPQLSHASGRSAEPSVGPIRVQTSRVSHPAPYTYGPRWEPPGGHHLPAEDDVQASSPAPTGPMSSVVPNQPSRSAAPREEILACIRENICEHLKNGSDDRNHQEYLVRLAEPLFQLPEPERWPAQVFMTLTAIKEIAAVLRTQLAAPTQSADTTQASKPSLSPSASMKNFVRTHIRQILLSSDLDCYGRRGSCKNHAARTPFTLIKALVAKQDALFLSQLPHDYRDNLEWNSQFDTLITEQLKADKHKLASFVQSNLPSGALLTPVTKLSELVADTYSGMLPRFKNVPSPQINQEVPKADKARLAYLRLMININRHQRNVAGDAKTPTFWHQINDDLQARVGKGEMYKLAFAQLILRKDRTLWNGNNTINDVNPPDFALPTEDEIAAEVNRIFNGEPTTEDEEEPEIH